MRGFCSKELQSEFQQEQTQRKLTAVLLHLILFKSPTAATTFASISSLIGSLESFANSVTEMAHSSGWQEMTKALLDVGGDWEE
jgi:hypothetical protein